MTSFTFLKARFIVLCLIFLSSSPLLSQWTQTSGPEETNIRSIIEYNDLLFAASNNGGVYKSFDQGTTWVKSSSGLQMKEGVWLLKEDNGVLYASVFGSGIYKSVDLGASWTPINRGVESLTFYTLDVKNGHLFAGNANGGVYYSSDNGETWARKGENLITNQATEIIFSGTRIYVSTRKLYYSDDYGDSWSEASLPNSTLNGIRTMETGHGGIYFADDSYLYFTEDNFETWTKLPIVPFSTGKRIQLVNDSIYFVANGSIFISHDRGVSWKRINRINNYSFNDLLFRDMQVFVATNGGIYSSLDEGIIWSKKNSGIRSFFAQWLYVNDEHLFTSNNSNHGLYKYEEKNDIWSSAESGLELGYNSRSVYALESHKNQLFAGTGDGLYKSVDKGNSWSLVHDPGINKGIRQIVSKGNLMYSTLRPNGLIVTNDSGVNWTTMENQGLDLSQTDVRSLVSSGSSFALTTLDSKIFFSEDNGNNWTDITISSGYLYVPKILFHNNKLYAATFTGLYYTENQGQTWKLLHGNNNLAISDFIIESEIIYAATKSGVWQTTLKKDQWFAINQDLEPKNIESIQTINSRLYIGTFTSGIWSKGFSEMQLPLFISNGPQGITIPEDTMISFSIEDFVVDGLNTKINSTYSLNYLAGEHYTVENNQIIPESDFSGEIVVGVTVSGNNATSNTFEIPISVLPVNDPPKLVGHKVGFFFEDTYSLTIETEDLIIEDPDSSEFTISITEGDNYTVQGNVLTLAPDYEGEIVIPIRVNDGIDDSNLLEIPLTITPPSNYDFDIQVNGETCFEKNNGSMQISAPSQIDFTAIVNETSYEFNGQLTLSDLAPGTYSICLIASGEFRGKCFEFQIEAAQNLQASSSINEIDNKKILNVSVSRGTPPFRVIKNGVEEKSFYGYTFKHPIEPGNSYTIKSSNFCEGAHEVETSKFSTVGFYPNPVISEVHIPIADNLNEVRIKVFNAGGNLVLETSKPVTKHEVTLNMESLPSGVYYLAVSAENLLKTIKVIK